MRLWVEPAGGEQKSADVEWKMVTLIYPYPIALDEMTVDEIALAVWSRNNNPSYTLAW
jgi:hypothetical protein